MMVEKVDLSREYVDVGWISRVGMRIFLEFDEALRAFSDQEKKWTADGCGMVYNSFQIRKEKIKE
jgi:hypothetical protein